MLIDLLLLLMVEYYPIKASTGKFIGVTNSGGDGWWNC